MYRMSSDNWDFGRTKEGMLKPEFQYVYDLAVPPDITALTPEPLDGEVDSFEVRIVVIHEYFQATYVKLYKLLTLNEISTRMEEGLFKPNCALGK